MKKAITNVEEIRKPQNTLDFKASNKIIKIKECKEAGVPIKVNEEEGIAVKVNKEKAISVKVETPISNQSNLKPNDDVECLGVKEMSNKKSIPQETYDNLLNSALNMLNLKKYNVVVLGYCQLLAMCLAYFGKRRHDESERNKKMIKLKCSLINVYYHNLVDDTMSEKRHNHWRKHAT